MPLQTPACCDTKLQLLTKILLQIKFIGSNTSSATDPNPSDGSWELYYKILLALPSIST